MPKTAIHKARQHLTEIAGIAEINLEDKPAILAKLLKAVRAVDRLLTHIEELNAMCSNIENCPTKRKDS